MSKTGEDHASLRVEGLRKRYGRKEAVRDVSFSMRSGEIVGLLGPNGAGKTTVFYIIVGFIKATSGSIYMNETDITRRPMYRRALEGISYLPQEASVFRKLSVENNIWAILETRKDLSTEEKKARLEELIQEFHLEPIRKRTAYPLSGGERRRTEIARSLAIDPKFLLLDEPFAGIDPIAVSEIKQLILKLADRGVGILITDHNVQHSLAITHRSYIIHLGEIVVHGDRESILANPLAREIYLGHDFTM
ncbi:MAG TPA: LPS export ABC transporter ATP-binding protein [Sediminispirochaeta sp.]|nr:LPS export ABC transporter ATP-binding protein [Sediminispirochaeta sp.]